MKTTTALAELKATDQDFEWYPTTDEIIFQFFKSINSAEIESLLDIGAGNGKVLMEFEKLKCQYNETTSDRQSYNTSLFAIEKSRALLDSLPVDIGILGTDLWEQSLLDKQVDCIFTNPPYSEFESWAVKVIDEANCNFIYMVLPQRWVNGRVPKAIERRQAKHKVIGSFDFLNSEDRAARAKVDLIEISMHDERYAYKRNRGIEPKTDPFALWVNDHFGLSEKPESNQSDYVKGINSEKTRKENLETALVSGRGLIDVLSSLYQDELAFLISNYQKVSSLDEALFKELDISVKTIVSSIKSRVNGLKNSYWRELFTNYSPLTSRLTTSSLKNFQKTISRKTNIDFTANNAYAITVWAIKNADQYLEQQTIDTFDRMVSSACIINYKSNQKVYAQNKFRYNTYRHDKDHTHFKLDYRIVITGHSAISRDRWDSRGGLSKHAADFIDDILVVANNLGFTPDSSVMNHSFVAGEKQEFYCGDKNGRNVKLFEVRAYMNGNMHFKFNQEFMLAFNVEVGRLRGWIHNAQHAAEEMGEKVDHVSEFFNTAYSLGNDSSIVKLLTARAA